MILLRIVCKSRSLQIYNEFLLCLTVFGFPSLRVGKLFKSDFDIFIPIIRPLFLKPVEKIRFPNQMKYRGLVSTLFVLAFNFGFSQFSLDIDLYELLEKDANRDTFKLMLYEKGWQSIPNDGELKDYFEIFAYNYNSKKETADAFITFSKESPIIFSIQFSPLFNGSPPKEYLSLVKQIQSDCQFFLHCEGMPWYRCPDGSDFPNAIGYTKKDAVYIIRTKEGYKTEFKDCD